MEKFGVWLLCTVKRTNRTDAAPSVDERLLICPLSALVNVPASAGAHGPAAEADVSIVYWPVEALAPSPQDADGSTPKPVTS